MAEQGYCATGTLRSDRTEYCPMQNTNDKQEEGRGSYDFRTADNVMLVRWADNSVVTAATNFENLAIRTTNRFSREKKTKSRYLNPLCSHRTTKELWIKMWLTHLADILFNVLQKKSLDIIYCANKLDQTKKLIAGKRNEAVFNKYF